MNSGDRMAPGFIFLKSQDLWLAVKLPNKFLRPQIIALGALTFLAVYSWLEIFQKLQLYLQVIWPL